MVEGEGGGQNIRDVRFMTGIDLGIAQTNLLDRLRASGAIDDKIVYLTKLFNEEVHLRRAAPPNPADRTAIDQLAGRTVNLGDAGSGTQSIARDVLGRLGVAVREVNLADRDAIAGLEAGDIDAVVLLGGKPVPTLAMRKGLRLLALPFARQLRDDFLPATLSAEDYPGVVEPGRRVDTLAVGTVLIAHDWPRDSDHYRGRSKEFVDASIPTRSTKLRGRSPRHPKWREVNLAATLPGWTRFGAAETWLKQHREPSEVAREGFEQFVSAHGGEPATAKKRERLFREFLKWNEARERQ